MVFFGFFPLIYIAGRGEFPEPKLDNMPRKIAVSDGQLSKKYAWWKSQYLSAVPGFISTEIHHSSSVLLEMALPFMNNELEVGVWA